MKKFVLLFFLISCISPQIFAQDISRREVPSIIRNNFQNEFPKAKDTEWEKTGEDYKVEFEIGFWNDDHTAWYNPEGKLVKHKKEIAKKELPAAIHSVLSEQYRWFLVTDAEQIMIDDQITYKVELRSFIQEWEVLFSEAGAIIEQWRD